jgi:phage antirepressor YoqD-like protein
MSLSSVIQRAIQDEDFARELREAASSAEGKALGSPEFKKLTDYFTLDASGAQKMTPDGKPVTAGLTTVTTTTTYTTGACTTTGTTTTTTGN